MSDHSLEQSMRKLSCSFCGAVYYCSAQEMEYIRIIPPCTRCRERTWLHVDGLPASWPSAYRE